MLGLKNSFISNNQVHFSLFVLFLCLVQILNIYTRLIFKFKVKRNVLTTVMIHFRSLCAKYKTIYLNQLINNI